jgi:hypothetical protein
MLERRFRFRVIQYFRDSEALILNFWRDSTLNEDEFLDIILNDMRRECLEDIERLSICQCCESESDVLPFINNCLGRVSREGEDILSIKFKNRINQLLNEF